MARRSTVMGGSCRDFLVSFDVPRAWHPCDATWLGGNRLLGSGARKKAERDLRACRKIATREIARLGE